MRTFKRRKSANIGDMIHDRVWFCLMWVWWNVWWKLQSWCRLWNPSCQCSVAPWRPVGPTSAAAGPAINQRRGIRWDTNVAPSNESTSRRSSASSWNRRTLAAWLSWDGGWWKRRSASAGNPQLPKQPPSPPRPKLFSKPRLVVNVRWGPGQSLHAFRHVSVNVHRLKY